MLPHFVDALLGIFVFLGQLSCLRRCSVDVLDRIMLWNFYYINGLGSPGYRLVYWDKFDQPEFDFRLQRSGWIDTWWYDEAKAENVRTGMAKLTGK